MWIKSNKYIISEYKKSQIINFVIVAYREIRFFVYYAF